VVLRFRGLPFARWHENKVFFGTDSTWAELRSKNEPALKQLIANLRNFRNPLASNLRHALYRAQAERWMQTLVHQDVTALISPSIPNTSTNRYSLKLPASAASWISCASHAIAALPSSN
jgi:hypothetical protein